MNELFKLNNTVKHYDWGSPDFIPRLLGIDGGGRPWAELWMGVHPGGPSATEFRGRPVSLPDLIAKDAGAFLGEGAAKQFGGLPFLFKFLAAAKPLSIQAHPNRDQARRGFERENQNGIAPDDPRRNYRDPSHKPEVLCALSPFTAMCGFRTPPEIRANLGRFLSGAPPVLQRGMAPLMAALAETGPSAADAGASAADAGVSAADAGASAANAGAAAADAGPSAAVAGAAATDAGAAAAVAEAAAADAGALRSFFAALFRLSPETRDALTGYIRQGGGTGAAAGTAAGCLAAFAELYPGDPAIIAPLYLNLLNLQPGEAVYLEAGVLHAYIEGFGVELMANSDNVLRGGLTPKHIDLPELMQVLDFSPRRPEILRPPEPAPFWYTYAVPCGEFSLSVLQGRGEEGLFPERGPAILALVRGEAKLSTGPQTLVLSPGESVFIPARQPGETLRYAGSFTAYAAALPGTGPAGP